MYSCGIWVCMTVNCLKILIIALTVKQFTHAEVFDQGESERSKDTGLPFWPIIAGAAIIIVLLLVVMVCCFMLKQNKTSDQPCYVNRREVVQDDRKDQTIYENDEECRKHTSKGKRQFSSLYINRPENRVAIYVNSAAEADETYANCTDNDYENVE